MTLDKVECVLGLELGLHDHSRAEHFMQGCEERDAAVVARPAHQVDIGLCELENGDDLENILDVHTVWPPGTFWLAGRTGRVDHHSPKRSSIRLARLLAWSRSHPLFIGE